MYWIIDKAEIITFYGLFILWVWYGLKVINEIIKSKKKKKIILESLNAFISEAKLETKLYNENPIPSDDDILLYYKMYVKKWDMDHKNQWTTMNPMTFDQWERCAKASPDDKNFLATRWRFMIPATCDMFVGVPHSFSMHRLVDYKKLVKKDDIELMKKIEETN